jgi:hypothetical protein
MRARLEDARSTRRYVRLERKIAGADYIDGYVVDIGAKWVLVARLDPMIVLDGFIAVRIADVSNVAERTSSERFVQRALEIRGAWPPDRSVPALDLDDKRGLLTTAGSQYPLITIHTEKLRPDVCYIGAFYGFAKGQVGLLSLTTNAFWEDEVTGFQLSGITRVDVGGHYEVALRQVAGPRPELESGS